MAAMEPLDLAAATALPEAEELGTVLNFKSSVLNVTRKTVIPQALAMLSVLLVYCAVVGYYRLNYDIKPPEVLSAVLAMHAGANSLMLGFYLSSAHTSFRAHLDELRSFQGIFSDIVLSLVTNSTKKNSLWLENNVQIVRIIRYVLAAGWTTVSQLDAKATCLGDVALSRLLTKRELAVLKEAGNLPFKILLHWAGHAFRASVKEETISSDIGVLMRNQFPLLRRSLGNLYYFADDRGSVPFIYYQFLWLASTCLMLELPWTVGFLEEGSHYFNSFLLMTAAILVGFGQFGALVLAHSLLRPLCQERILCVPSLPLIDTRVIMIEMHAHITQVIKADKALANPNLPLSDVNVEMCYVEVEEEEEDEQCLLCRF